MRIAGQSSTNSQAPQTKSLESSLSFVFLPYTSIPMLSTTIDNQHIQGTHRQSRYTPPVEVHNTASWSTKCTCVSKGNSLYDDRAPKLTQLMYLFSWISKKAYCTVSTSQSKGWSFNWHFSVFFIYVHDPWHTNVWVHTHTHTHTHTHARTCTHARTHRLMPAGTLYTLWL